MALIPEKISDQEVIVRGVCSPYHVKNGKLKPGLYDPTPGTDEISVMRHDYMGSDACKAKAKDLENPAENKVYRGLAVLTAAHIRWTTWEIIDSRRWYPGHADIKVGLELIKPKGDPLPPEKMQLLRDRQKDLLKRTNFFFDPDPQAIPWTGEKLVPKS